MARPSLSLVGKLFYLDAPSVNERFCFSHEMTYHHEPATDEFPILFKIRPIGVAVVCPTSLNDLKDRIVVLRITLSSGSTPIALFSLAPSNINGNKVAWKLDPASSVFPPHLHLLKLYSVKTGLKLLRCISILFGVRSIEEMPPPLRPFHEASMIPTDSLQALFDAVDNAWETTRKRRCESRNNDMDHKTKQRRVFSYKV